MSIMNLINLSCLSIEGIISAIVADIDLMRQFSETTMKRIKSHFKTLLLSPWPYRVIRVALAGLFIFGGGIKLLDPKAFAATISAYGLVPEPLLPFVAVGLPLAEVLAGFGLLFDIRGSLTTILGLLGLFVFVLWYGILNDLDVDCGCFGPEELASQGKLWNAFYRDLILVGLVVPFLYASRWMRARSAIQQNVTKSMMKGESNNVER